MVVSEKIYSVSTYLELVTGDYYLAPRDLDDINFIERVLAEHGYDSVWNFPLSEIDHIVENNLRVVLVECFDGDADTVLRWFEVPENKNYKEKKIMIYGNNFYGNPISAYGIEHKRVDYAALAKAVGGFRHNEIINYLSSRGPMEVFCGEEDEDTEFMQYILIPESGAKLLRDLTREVVFYSPDADLYVWGITHFGTSWECVLTEIEVEP